MSDPVVEKTNKRKKTDDGEEKGSHWSSETSTGLFISNLPYSGELIRLPSLTAQIAPWSPASSSELITNRSLSSFAAPLCSHDC